MKRIVIVVVGLAILLVAVIYSVKKSSSDGETIGVPERQREIWEEVKKKAESSGHPKALWRELKQLEPAELLVCAEEICEAHEDGQEKEKNDAGLLITNDAGFLITINAILSYHADKVGWEETAKAVGSIVEGSDNASLVYSSLEWIENIEGYKNIPEGGMRAIAQGLLQGLDPSRGFRIRTIVLRKIGSDEIWMGLSQGDKQMLLDRCKSIIVDPKEEELKRTGEKTLKKIDAIEEELRLEARSRSL
jgi:hypothetical protein